MQSTPTVISMRRTKRIDQHILEHFGRQLDEWVRDAHGGNQTSTGKALGLSQGHISAMIQGARGPGLPTLIALREKTGRSIDDLLGLSKAPTARRTPVPSAGLPTGRELIEMLRQTADRIEEQAEHDTKPKGPASVPMPHQRRRPS